MKTREEFDAVRLKRDDRLSLRVRLTLLVCAELVVCALTALLLYVLLRDLVDMDSTLLLFFDLLLTGLLIGSVVTGYLSKLFFNPIKKLRHAMDKVSEGDFSVRLDETSSSKEVMEIYSGFNLMAHELEATEILQTDFVSNVSHEFKTPINAIEGYATLLQGSSNLDGDEREYVDKIVFNTRRLSSLVGSILLLSRLENQEIPTGRTCYKLDEQIRQSVVALEPEWTRKELEFDVELERVDYVGNEAMMRHVWDNLIGNAVKFDPPCGLVRIRLTQEEGRIRFTVEDSGPGLSEEAEKHLFDKFYQGDSSHKQEGNGLGLALVKRILSISGGTVSAENLPAGGCRFTVVLNGN